LLLGLNESEKPYELTVVLHRLDYAESRITDILKDRYTVTTDPDKKPYPGVEENLFL
jgi:hypothetical protein